MRCPGFIGEAGILMLKYWGGGCRPANPRAGGIILIGLFMVVMRKKKPLLIALFFVTGAIIAYGIHAAIIFVYHADACQVIMLELTKRNAANDALSDEEIRSMIAGLINAGVIHGRIGPDGAPTDLNGNPFVIEQDAKHISVATEGSIWQPFTVEYEYGVKFELHDMSLQPTRKSG